MKMAERGWYERDYKTFRQTINWACRNRFSFAWWKGSLGACFGPKWPPVGPFGPHEKVPSFMKEAERGWKSGARSLSWKSGWKPSTIREFWRQRICGSFFRLEVTAVWKKKCPYKKICNSKTLLLLKLNFGQHFTERAQCIITHVIYMDIYPYQYRAEQKRMSSSNNICALLGFLCTAKQRGNLLTQCFFNLFYLSDCYRDICKKQCLGTSWMG